MASSVSGQDELNPALRLASQAGKMELSFPLGATSCIPKEKNFLNPLLTKLVQSRWLDVVLLFFAIYGRRLCLSP